MDTKVDEFAFAGKFFRIVFFLMCLSFLFPDKSTAQDYRQILKGTVTDQESHQPLSGVYVLCESCNPAIASVSDSLGRFRLDIPVGRHAFSFILLGYLTKQISDVQIGTGKEIFLNVELSEQVFQTEEIAVKASSNRWINPMATVSARTLRSDDATRYAAGYFDASRMVTNFAGVASGNSDDNNEIIIRGNSPRGLLWRLEGIEIPNPNHFSNGQGSSGGGYSAITTNVLSSFDFFTGSFPAEYGNAYSGVMDLNLRSGNPENHEFSVALSVLGTEASAEGPLNRKKGSSYLFDYRLADFQYLTRLGILDAKDYDIVPRTSDYAFKASFKTEKSGTFDVFAVGGSSEAGDLATANVDELKAGVDQDEFLERQTTAVAGIKHTFSFPNNKTYIRSTAAFTYQFTSDRDRKSDTLLNKKVTYYDRYEYPAFRFASAINHKLNPRHSLRAGITFNQMSGQMFAIKLNSKLLYDTLMNTNGNGWYGSSYAQWKYKSGDWIETNTGLHVLFSGITHEVLVEPRWGMIIRLPKKQSFNFGLGLHSRIEPLSVYHYKVKVSSTLREERNLDLKSTKAFHFTSGYTRNFGNNLQFSMEAYYQYLWAIPISKVPTGQFSLVNSIGGLSDVIMANNGKSRNTGLEFTLEKSFSRQYYFLATASLFNSKYLAPDGTWYNTYFNTNYVYNLLGGKEFQVGQHRQNTFGLKLRANFRGGFRYTPVNETASLKSKRVVYQTTETYGERLPDFNRVDFGVSYRINKKRNAWILLADIQNVLNTRNVLRRKFSYSNKQIVISDSKGIGMVPVLTVRAEF
ncbi:MAG: carboxypeptidase-like regulatory domain-containing protein [Prolixibacteraceae bacterium]|nr:carboxypeptidase-like regulatory domain-containing protein [Prolixibacteraceae bacterium]